MNEHAQEFKWVGKRPIRPDGVDKVTGRAKFGADYDLPGQLVGKVLRSPHGGHVAFLGAARAAGGAGSSDPDRRWGENRLVQFCVERARARGWSGAVW